MEIDGEEISATRLGTAIVKAPGPHLLRAEAPGREPIEVEVELVVGTTKTVPMFFGAGDKSNQPVLGNSDTASDGDGLMMVGFIVGGVGVAGLIVGGIFGGLALAKKGVVDDNCSGLSCTDEGKEAADTGDTFGNVSTVGFVVGGAALAASVILIIVGSSADEEPSTAWSSRRPLSVRW